MTHEQLETQGATLLLGAPGSGKTQALLEAATGFIEQGKDPARLLVLTPSRVSATRFREALSARITATVSTAPVRAWQAYAFDLLRRAHIEGYLPHLDFTPKLLSGPEQDVLIKELLDGHRSGEGSSIIWPDDLREALETRGFRHEVRDFFDRIAEYDLTASAVADLAQRFDRPEWRALAKLYTEYRQVRALRAPHAFDPAALIHEATKTLLAHPNVLSAERARFDLVLIDDVQELTPSIYRLLAVLTGRSAEYLRATASNSLASGAGTEPADLDGLFASGPVVVMTCCADTVVQGFRGASPQLAANLPDIFPSLVTEELTTSWRMAPVIAERWAELASRLPVVPRAAHRRVLTPAPQEPSEEALLPVGDDGALLNPAKAAEPDPEVLGLVVETPQQENQLLAQMILEDHLYRGRAYQRSAIIVRNGSDVTRLKRALNNLGGGR